MRNIKEDAKKEKKGAAMRLEGRHKLRDGINEGMEKREKQGTERRRNSDSHGGQGVQRGEGSWGDAGDPVVIQ